MGRRELFVYYRVAVGDEVPAAREVEALQAVLRRAVPGLGARLLRRPEAVDGLTTWMEVYAMSAQGEGGGVDAAVQARIEHEASQRLTCIAGPRHAEAFVALE